MRQLFNRTAYRMRSTCRRYATAWRYAIGRSSLTDGYNLLHEAEQITGIYGLETLSVQSLTDSLVERYGEEHRETLERLAARACDRVASKWNQSGDITGAAEDWAGDLVAGYAEDEGLQLVDSWEMAA